jgi:Tfp pilus assembly protein PilF
MTDASPTIQQLLQLAMQSHQAGDLAGAESLYRQVLRQAPQHPDALHLLGYLAYQDGRHEAAIDLIGQAIRITGGSPRHYSNLALALEALQRDEEAAASYRKALSLDPTFKQALTNLCRLLGRCTAGSGEILECHLQLAERFLSEGNLAPAEVCCREALDHDGGNARALRILSSIYEKAGLNHVSGDGAARPSPREGVTAPRYLLMKSWGFGFWSDVSSVLGALLLAEVTNRIPVTHWGDNSLFRDGSGRDAFGLYFEPLSEFDASDLAQLPGASFFPPKWDKTNLGQEDLGKWQGPYSRLAPMQYVAREESVVVCDFFVNVVDVMPWMPPHHPMHGRDVREVYHWLIQKYLRPRPDIVGRADDFHRSQLAGAPFLALHLRGSDKVGEYKSLQTINQSSIERAREADPSWRIFLLTDDENWLRIMKDQFGSRVVATACTRTGTAQGVHYMAEGSDRPRIGREILVDTHVALLAERFIGNGWSNVSGMIALMKRWNAGQCVLYGSHRLIQRNLPVYVLGA